MPAPYGVIPQGFNMKQLAEILADINEGVRGVFGADVNVDPQSPNGQFNGIMANEIATLWELAHNVWTSTDPLQASGTRLDELLAAFNFPLRNSATLSGVALTFTGTPGTTIPASYAVSASTSGVSVFTSEVSIIPSSGTVVVQGRPVVEGAVSLVVSEIDTLVVPLTGVTSVTNLSAAVIGVLINPRESDLQVRQRLIGQAQGGNQVTNKHIQLEAILRGLTGVTDSVLYVNETGIVDNRGIPGKSYALVIEGGDDITIANTLWIHHTVGIGTYGTTSAHVTDAQGICHKINYSRPQEVVAFLKITVRYVDGRCGCQPNDLAGLKALLINLLDDKKDCDGFGIGQPLIRSRLYAAFSGVKGLEIVSLTMAKQNFVFSYGCADEADNAWNAKGYCEGAWYKEAVFSEESIPVAWNEKPVFVDQGIELTVVDKFDNTTASDCIDGVTVNG